MKSEYAENVFSIYAFSSYKFYLESRNFEKLITKQLHYFLNLNLYYVFPLHKTKSIFSIFYETIKRHVFIIHRKIVTIYGVTVNYIAIKRRGDPMRMDK